MLSVVKINECGGKLNEEYIKINQYQSYKGPPNEHIPNKVRRWSMLLYDDWLDKHGYSSSRILKVQFQRA